VIKKKYKIQEAILQAVNTVSQQELTANYVRVVKKSHKEDQV